MYNLMHMTYSIFMITIGILSFITSTLMLYYLRKYYEHFY